MKAAITVAPGRVEIHDVPEPLAGPKDVVVQIADVGICGSDLHAYTGDLPIGRNLANRGYPRRQGHEASGSVVGLPAGYAGRLRIGEHVAIEMLFSCGRCYACRIRRPNCCANMREVFPGALAERVAVPADLLYPIGDLDLELGALVEPLSIGVWANVRGSVTADDRVVILGAGPIGQAILLAARDRGARALVADRLPSRLDLARRLGAELTVLVEDEDLPAAVTEWTSGDGASVVFEATGVPAVIRTAIEIVAHAGRVVIVGVSGDEVSLPVREFTRKELSVYGSRNNGGVFDQALDLVRRQRDLVAQLITHRFPLDRTSEALRFALENPALVTKVIVKVDAQ